MPSGKLLSFLNGELSPSLRFKTNLVEYATGLSKLLNKTVKKSGGACNRSGFQFVQVVDFQTDLKVPGRVRLFTANISRADDESEEVPVSIVYPSKAGENPQVIGVADAVGVFPFDRDLTNVKVSQKGNLLIFSNGEEHWAMQRPDIGTGLQDKVLTPRLVIGVAGVFSVTSKTFNAPPADRKCTYSVYQVFRTGEEVFYATATGGLEPVIIGDSNSWNELSIPISADAEVKHYNVYRASRSDASDNPSNWGLVGRIPRPAADGPKTFADHIILPDVTNPPPDEDYLYGEFPSGKELVSARIIGYYQQRRVVIINSANSKLDEGSVVVSKAGAVEQLDTQVIFTDIGAFDFTMPIGVKSRIVGILELERLVLLTTDVAVVVRGGEEGLITPISVNPLVISHNGCSERVTPVYAGNYGFFMSKNEERLMRVSFSIDGNLGIDEVSLFSDHLLEESRVKEMALTRGKEDVLWLLKHDGTLVSITIHQGGQATGWAQHDTEGFIESISSLTVLRQYPLSTLEDNHDYDSLHVLVVREGVRYLERLSFREDHTDKKQQYFYCDNFSHFGPRLKLDLATNLYSNYISGAEFNPDIPGLDDDDVVIAKEGKFTSPFAINIEDGVNWDEDEDITLHSVIPETGAAGGIGQIMFSDITVAPEAKHVIDFFYEEDGITKSIRWTQTGITNANKGLGRFNGTVPVQLRDINAQGLDDAERRTKQTRWLRAKKKIGGLKRLAGKEVSIFADGIVVSSPLNTEIEYDPNVIDVDGYTELDDYFSWGVVGLPYTSELETLDLDTADERTLIESKKLINRVGIAFHETKGGFVGQQGRDLQKMEQLVTREGESPDLVNPNVNGHIDLSIPGQWEQTGRVLVKQVDPLPMTVLSIYPKGIAGD